MTQKKDHPFKKANMPFVMKVSFALTTLLFKVLGFVSPSLAGKLALRLFMKPPNARAPAREAKIREQAELTYRNFSDENGNDRKIAVRVWGDESSNNDKPTILLSHGWAGRTSQFLEFITPLVDAGYRVVGADIPAHDDSEGTYTNMLDASQILSKIAEEFGPLDAVIGHSFGTGTTLLAMDKFGLKSPKVILIGAYSRVSFIIKLFSEVFELNKATQKAMLQEATSKYSKTYGIEWNWESIAPINTIKSYAGNVFFIHDEGDYEVPINEVSELHQLRPDAKKLLTTGLGHRRILRNSDVVNEVITFIRD